MTQPFKGYEQTLSKARRFPSQDKARQVWSSGARHLEGMGSKVVLFPACVAQYFPHWKEVKSISGVYLSLQRAALSSPLLSVEEAPEKAKRHRPPPYLYTVGGIRPNPHWILAGCIIWNLRHCQSTWLFCLSNMLKNTYFFSNFFHCLTYILHWNITLPMRRVFTCTSKNHCFSRYLGWSKNILPYLPAPNSLALYWKGGWCFVVGCLGYGVRGKIHLYC